MGAFIAAIIMAMFTAFMVPFLVIMAGILSGTLFYLTWNTIAPIYFASVLPAQLLHFTWWHSVLFTMVWRLLFKSSASVKSEK